MVMLNKELNHLKYSFVAIENLEKFKVDALNLTKDNIMKGYYESTLSLDVKENNYVDDFFLNSTDTIVDRIYFIDENKELYVKYLVYNDSQTDKIKVCMIKNLTEDSVRLFEEKVLKDKNVEELEEHKVIKLLNILKEKIETLDNYNDSEIRGYLTVITNKLENLASNIPEIDMNAFNDKIEEFKTEILEAIAKKSSSQGETLTEEEFESLKRIYLFLLIAKDIEGEISKKFEKVVYENYEILKLEEGEYKAFKISQIENLDKYIEILKILNFRDFNEYKYIVSFAPSPHSLMGALYIKIIKNNELKTINGKINELLLTGNEKIRFTTYFSYEWVTFLFKDKEDIFNFIKKISAFEDKINNSEFLLNSNAYDFTEEED